MKTKLLLSFLLFTFAFCLLPCTAQVPLGFNYQAIARNSNGLPITSQTIPVRISIVTALTGGTVIWQEEHSSVTADQYGMISLVVGAGTYTAGTATSFSAIDWSAQTLYLKTEVKYPGPGWTDMGTSQIWAVPYSLLAKNVAPLSKLGISGTTDIMDEALFEVKNKTGNTVFAVYNEGVRAYVGNGVAKGVKGGFAVGGFDGTKTGTHDLFYVTSDSVRVYIDSNPSTKGTKGGFAVGGFDMTKGTTADYLNVNIDSNKVINPAENRILWYPLKNAFLTGKVLIESSDSIGINSFASGFKSKAIGNWSQALGYRAIARGNYSTAIGKNAITNNNNSFAFGDSAITGCAQTYALGYKTYAYGLGSLALGYMANSNGQDAFAIGSGTEADGQGSFAIGFIGRDSAGITTDNTRAASPWAVAIGMGAQAMAQGAFSIGTQTQAKGQYSLALGYKTNAIGYYSTSMGYETTAAYTATATGYLTNAGGMHSMAIGYKTSTTGVSSLATGSQTSATAPYSASFGKSTVASGAGSVAMGTDTKAESVASLVIGRFNDTTVYSTSSYRTWYPADPLFICGNGTADDSRTNAFIVYKSGQTDVSGTLRAIGSVTPSAGAGVEIYYIGGTGYLQCYDRTGAAYKPLTIYSGLVRPITDNTYALGSLSYRWTAVYAANGIIQTSDRRMKENITTLTEGLKTVLNLNPVCFTWKDQTDQKKHIGLIAQEVMPLVPEVVDTGNDPDKTLGINYAGLVPVLIKSIQEQQQQIESQQKQIDELKTLVNSLISR